MNFKERVVWGILLVILSPLMWMVGLHTLTIVALVGFGAMIAGAYLGHKHGLNPRPGFVALSYGLASGAMVASAALFLLPQAISDGSVAGSAGVAIGVLVGYATHTYGHQITHKLDYDPTVMELTIHSISGGAFIGLIYGTMPSIGPLLGLAIISHKAPAGYVAASRLASGSRLGARVSLIRFVPPAAAVGLSAFAVAGASTVLALPPSQFLQGVAAGVFVHVALDFLPRCEVGSDLHEACKNVPGDEHDLLDTLRQRAVLSTASGAGVILLLRALVG